MSASLVGSEMCIRDRCASQCPFRCSVSWLRCSGRESLPHTLGPRVVARVCDVPSRRARPGGPCPVAGRQPVRPRGRQDLA
eukprot:5801391-Alexandrium_andersonii.AAC.1